MDFKQKLTEALKHTSQAELARQSGVGITTINNWVRQGTTPSWELGKQVEKILDRIIEESKAAKTA